MITIEIAELVAFVAMAFLFGVALYAGIGECIKDAKKMKEAERQDAMLTQLQMEELALRNAAFNARKSMVREAAQTMRRPPSTAAASEAPQRPNTDPDEFWESDSWST